MGGQHEAGAHYTGKLKTAGVFLVFISLQARKKESALAQHPLLNLATSTLLDSFLLTHKTC